MLLHVGEGGTHQEWRSQQQSVGRFAEQKRGTICILYDQTQY